MLRIPARKNDEWEAHLPVHKRIPKDGKIIRKYEYGFSGAAHACGINRDLWNKIIRITRKEWGAKKWLEKVAKAGCGNSEKLGQDKYTDQKQKFVEEMLAHCEIKRADLLMRVGVESSVVSSAPQVAPQVAVQKRKNPSRSCSIKVIKNPKGEWT